MIPAKPSHLSPIVNKNFANRSTAVGEPQTKKVGVHKPPTATGGYAAPLAPAKEESDGPLEMESVRKNLQPVSKKIHADTEPVALEEGVKKISQDAIDNIRRDSNVVSINFSQPGSHLPGSAKSVSRSKVVGAGKSTGAETKPPDSPTETNGKQAGHSYIYHERLWAKFLLAPSLNVFNRGI